MIPKEFDYVAPGTLDEAASLLMTHGDDAKVLAGGHSLIPLLKLRLGEPALLIDLGRIGPLRGLDGNGGQAISIGAMTRHADLAAGRDADAGLRLLAESAAQVGDTQVRNRGTLGGSLAHADPAADLTAAVLALDAELEATRMRRDGTATTTRRIPASRFFTGLLTTALEPGEILTRIWLERRAARTGSAYVKLRNKASHYALVGVAAVVTLDSAGKVSEAALAVTGAGATPFRVADAEAALQGGAAGNGAVDQAATLVSGHDVEWMSDLHGSAEYRQAMAAVLARRAIHLALQRASA